MLYRLLASRRFLLLAATLGLILSLPALGTGWQIDDLTHRAALLHPGRLPEPVAGVVPEGNTTGLFRFIEGPETVRRSRELGSFPWWSTTELKAVFFRPLAAATHLLDYRLWPDSAYGMHAHSLVWLFLLFLALGSFYRRLGDLPRAEPGHLLAAGLAVFLYVIDDARSTPIAWLANRNALLAALFGTLALVAHDWWRRDAWRPGALIGPLLLSLSLLSAEAGVATVAYLIAHAFYLDSAPWRSRLGALSPYLLLALLWRFLSMRLDVGTAAMGVYLDPGAEPLRFMAAVIERAPLLLLGQWSPIPAETAYLVGATGYRVLWGVAAVLIAVLATAFRPLLRRDPVARFFGVGMLLSLVPACAAFPDNRLLVFAGIGASGLLARFLAPDVVRWLRPRGTETKHLPVGSKLLVLFLVLTHAVMAPIGLPARIQGQSRLYARMSIATPLEAGVERQSVVLVNGPFVLFPAQLPIMSAVRGEPVPRHTRILSPSFAAVSLYRPDARTLVLCPEGGYLASRLDTLFRDCRRPMSQGERVVLPDVTITVTALTPDGRPGTVSCRFREPLESPSLCWLAWSEQGFQPFTPPAVGRSLALPAPRLAPLLR